MATRPSGSAPPIWHDPTFRSRPERSQKREGLRVADKPTSSSILAPPVLRDRPETQWPLERFKPRRENPRGHDVFGLHAREIPNAVACTARYRDRSVEIQALVAVMSRRPEARWVSFSSSSLENMKYHTNAPHLLPMIVGMYRLPCMIMHDSGIVANFRTLNFSISPASLHDSKPAKTALSTTRGSPPVHSVRSPSQKEGNITLLNATVPHKKTHRDLSSSPPIESILRFWYAIEALSPAPAPKLDSPSQRAHTHRRAPSEPQVIHVPSKEHPEMPWNDDHFLRQHPAGPGACWMFRVFLPIYPSDDLMHLLASQLDPSPELMANHLASTDSVIFSWVYLHGQPIPSTLSIALSAFAAGEFLCHGFRRFEQIPQRFQHYHDQEVHQLTEQFPLVCSSSMTDDALRDMAARLLQQVNQPDIPPTDPIPDFLQTLATAHLLPQTSEESATFEPVTTRDVFMYARDVVKRLGITALFHDAPMEARVVCQRVPDGTSTPFADQKEKVIDRSAQYLLNSFFLGDLSRIQQSPISPHSALSAYLIESSQPKIDVRQQLEDVRPYVLPAQYPIGRWPAHHALVYSQQVAVNAILHHSPHPSSALFAVNGPPGTGKTTILRDVAADIVVQQACRLIEYETPAEAFAVQSESVRIDARPFHYYPFIADGLRDAILVASSNNGAVENVTLELPGIHAIDHQWINHVDYFRDLAATVLGKPAWGLLAGRLGNKQNRSAWLISLSIAIAAWRIT